MYDPARYAVVTVSCSREWNQRIGAVPDRYKIQSVQRRSLTSRDAFALAKHLNVLLLARDDREHWAVVAPPGLLNESAGGVPVHSETAATA